MLVLQRDAAAVDKGPRNGVGAHVEQVAFAEHQRGAFAGFQGAVVFVDAHNLGRGERYGGQGLLLGEAEGHGGAGHKGQVARAGRFLVALVIEAEADAGGLQLRGQLVGLVVVVGVAAGQRVNARHHHADVVLLQKIEHHPGIAGAHHGHLLRAQALGKPDGFDDFLAVVGVQVQGFGTVKYAGQGRQPQVFLAAGRELAVGAGFTEKLFEVAQLVFAGFLAAVQHGGVFVGAEAEHHRGPGQVLAVVGAHHGVLPVPGIELHHAALAAQQAAARGGLGQQHAVGAHRGRDVRIGVVGNDGPHVGVQRAHLLLVHGGPDGLHLRQAQRGVGHYQAGIQVLPGRIDGFETRFISGEARGRAGIRQAAFVKSHRGVGHHRAVADVQRGARDEHRPGLGRGGRGHLGQGGAGGTS